MSRKICYVIKGNHHHEEESEERKEGVEVVEHKHHLSVHMHDGDKEGSGPSTVTNSDYF